MITDVLALLTVPGLVWVWPGSCRWPPGVTPTAKPGIPAAPTAVIVTVGG